jgi:hypothetical protein
MVIQFGYDGKLLFSRGGPIAFHADCCEDCCLPCGEGSDLAPAEFEINISGIINGYNCSASGCGNLNGLFTVGNFGVGSGGEWCGWGYNVDIDLCTHHTTSGLSLIMDRGPPGYVTVLVQWFGDSSGPDPNAVLCEFRSTFVWPVECLTFDEEVASYREHGFYHCDTRSATCTVTAL